MAQIREVDKKELKVLTEELLDVSKELLDLRRRVMIRLILLYIYEFIWAGLLYFSLSVKLVESYPVCFCVANLLLYIILTLYNVFFIELTLSLYKAKYRIGVQKLSNLVNFVDWDVYRRRQLYNDTNPDVDKSIGGFLAITRLMISPTSERNKFFKIFVVASVVFKYVLLSISLYLCIMQWV